MLNADDENIAYTFLNDAYLRVCKIPSDPIVYWLSNTTYTNIYECRYCNLFCMVNCAA